MCLLNCACYLVVNTVIIYGLNFLQSLNITSLTISVNVEKTLQVYYN